MRVLRFIAGVEDGIHVALCLDHDVVTQAPSKAALIDECERVMLCLVAYDREEGLDPWTREPPPPDVIAEFNALPDAWVFTITVQDE